MQPLNPCVFHCVIMTEPHKTGAKKGAPNPQTGFFDRQANYEDISMKLWLIILARSQESLEADDN